MHRVQGGAQTDSVVGKGLSHDWKSTAGVVTGTAKKVRLGGGKRKLQYRVFQKKRLGKN